MSVRHIALVSVLLTGCAGFQPQPIERPVNPPAQWHIGGAGAGEAVGARWWYTFDDEELNRLIHRALSNNPDLAATAQAVIQADLQLRNAGAALLPTLVRREARVNRQARPPARIVSRVVRVASGCRLTTSWISGGVACPPWKPGGLSRVSRLGV